MADNEQPVDKQAQYPPSAKAFYRVLHDYGENKITRQNYESFVRGQREINFFTDSGWDSENTVLHHIMDWQFNHPNLKKIQAERKCLNMLKPCFDSILPRLPEMERKQVLMKKNANGYNLLHQAIQTGSTDIVYLFCQQFRKYLSVDEWNTLFTESTGKVSARMLAASSKNRYLGAMVGRLTTNPEYLKEIENQQNRPPGDVYNENRRILFSALHTSAQNHDPFYDTVDKVGFQFYRKMLGRFWIINELTSSAVDNSSTDHIRWLLNHLDITIDQRYLNDALVDIASARPSRNCFHALYSSQIAPVEEVYGIIEDFFVSRFGEQNGKNLISDMHEIPDHKSKTPNMIKNERSFRQGIVRERGSSKDNSPNRYKS